MSRYAIRLAPCDLGDPGWGDPWFPHGAVLLPSPACMALCVFSFPFFFVWFLVYVWPYWNVMTQCCHHLHESTNELVASHRVSVFGFVLVLLFVFCGFGFCFVCLCCLLGL